MAPFIGILGFLGFIICILMMVISFFRKTGKIKKFGIGALATLIMFIGAVAATPPSPENSTVSKSTTASSSNVEKKDTATTDNTVSKDNTQKNDENKGSSSEGDKSNTTSSTNGKLKVHFIDVGQADSILIQDNGKSMLIDAGNNADSDAVVNYIKSQGISKLDIVIGTHAHEDHIGGLDKVINSFDIGNIYLPKQQSTTKTFEDVLIAIKNKGLKITTPTPNSTFKLNSAEGLILAPKSSSYEDINNSSVVVKLTFGSNSFMFTGDAEDVSEKEILNGGFNLSADLLKVGHHGSSSSTTQAFLDKVNPKYAVISVGKGNSYGHPNKGTMDRLKNKAIKVYRTDESGTIIATSDGINITFNVNAGSYNYASTGTSTNTNTSSSSGSTTTTTPKPTAPKPTTPTQTQPTTGSGSSTKTVYFTPGGGSYHYDKNCRTLSRSKTILSGTLSEAISKGKDDPCDVCVH